MKANSNLIFERHYRGGLVYLYSGQLILLPEHLCCVFEKLLFSQEITTCEEQFLDELQKLGLLQF